MVIDLILDRKGGKKYSASEFYSDVFDYHGTWPDIAFPITRAMDEGKEQDIISELCKYVKEQGWPETICNYICAVKWLEDDPENAIRIDVTYEATASNGKTYEERFTTWQQVPNLLACNLDEPESIEKATMRPLTDAIGVAMNMGWQLWQKISVYVPEIECGFGMQPKSEAHARELQQKLEEMKQRSEQWRGETDVVLTEEAAVAI